MNVSWIKNKISKLKGNKNNNVAQYEKIPVIAQNAERFCLINSQINSIKIKNGPKRKQHGPAKQSITWYQASLSFPQQYAQVIFYFLVWPQHQVQAPNFIVKAWINQGSYSCYETIDESIFFMKLKETVNYARVLRETLVEKELGGINKDLKQKIQGLQNLVKITAN